MRNRLNDERKRREGIALNIGDVNDKFSPFKMKSQNFIIRIVFRKTVKSQGVGINIVLNVSI